MPAGRQRLRCTAQPLLAAQPCDYANQPALLGRTIAMLTPGGLDDDYPYACAPGLYGGSTRRPSRAHVLGPLPRRQGVRGRVVRPSTARPAPTAPPAARRRCRARRARTAPGRGCRPRVHASRGLLGPDRQPGADAARGAAADDVNDPPGSEPILDRGGLAPRDANGEVVETVVTDVEVVDEVTLP